MFKLWDRFKDLLKRMGFYFQVTPNIDSLIKYAYSDSARLRRKVAANINTPVGTLEKLAQDPVAEVRMVVARNSNVSDKALQMLASDSNYDIKHIAIEKIHERNNSILDISDKDIEKKDVTNERIENDAEQAVPVENDAIVAEDKLLKEYDMPNLEVSKTELVNLEQYHNDAQNILEAFPDKTDKPNKEKACEDFHYVIEACEKIKKDRYQHKYEIPIEQINVNDRSDDAVL